MRTKAVLFDLDGVLVDACDWHFKAFNIALEDITGVRISRKEEHKFNALPSISKLEILSKQGRIRQSDFKEFLKLKQKYTKIMIEEHCFRDKTKINMCETLKFKNLKLGCGTNCSRETAILMLEKTGVINFLDSIITNKDIGFPKPNSEAYIRNMVDLGVYPDETIIVEDSPRGLEAAYNTGAHVIKVENAKEVNTQLFKGLLI